MATQDASPLAGLIRAEIAAGGPIGVDRFMMLALAHPEHGYYRKRDPLGRDFTTAPEISQMFGELAGLWLAVVWQQMGRPDPVILAELGPGRGTLMADALRATAGLPGFHAAIRLHLVETSPVLRALQAERLAGARPTWHDEVTTLPSGPLLLVANEFFDALPIQQFMRDEEGWRERRIGLAGDELGFVAGPPAPITVEADPGAILERCPAAEAVVAALGNRLAQGGAALIFDYGHPVTAPGETLQALRGGRPVPVLDEPGESDLTAHIDFERLAAAATPATAWPLLSQGDFLRRMGIETRAEKLVAANPQRAAEIASACRRLIHRREMGNLFKALAVTAPGLDAPGFDTPSFDTPGFSL